MSYDPPDRRKFCLQTVFDLVHRCVDIIDGLRRREAAVIVNEKALVIFPNADVVKVAQAGMLPGQHREQVDDCR
jgi:hypothetical protein